MKNLYSLRDLEEMARVGSDLVALTKDAMLTPSAHDFLREWNNKPSAARKAQPQSPAPSAPAAGAPRFSGKIPTLSSSQAEIDAWFYSPEMEAHKQNICDIGRRMWERSYCDGNGGNISLRLTPDFVLCTPTLVSKGFLKPEQMCLVDMEGNQKAGTAKRTSEVLMHLQMMKAQPRALACAHCHPPHATAYAVAGVEPPTCMIPEAEVMIGKVPMAEYRTPGTPEMGKLVSELCGHHNTILMGNHGAVSWSHVSVEDAYWKMEILESFCHTVWVATQLGAPLKTMTGTQVQDLLKIKSTLGIVDPRMNLKECELCNNDDWRPGVTIATPPATAAEATPDKEAEALVQAITEQILAKLKNV